MVWLDVPEAFEDDVENKLPILEEVPRKAIKSKDDKPTHLLIEGDNYQKDIDQLIFIATPHKGAPKAYLMWEGGEMEPKPEERPSELILKFEALENGYFGDGALSRYIKEKQIYSVKELLPIYNYLFDSYTLEHRQKQYLSSQ